MLDEGVLVSQPLSGLAPCLDDGVGAEGLADAFGQGHHVGVGFFEDVDLDTLAA